MKNFTPTWYVVYTRPRHEKKLEKEFSELEIETFLPTTRTFRQWHDRKKYLELPLFPSYVFVYLENAKAYYNSLTTESILYYVRIGNEIATVSNSVIEKIRLSVNSGLEIEVSDDYLKPGRNLVIKEGPFASHSCEVIEYKGKQKILVRIDLLQRGILLNLNVDYLAPACAS